MHITKLTLTNFRSFKKEQSIEFAPVTLLFGPNSVGKSSVLMALFYIQQILERGQCNPHKIDALGEKLVGGFKNLVHGRDTGSNIIIRIEYDKAGQIGSSYTYIIDLLGEQIELPISSPSSEVTNTAIEFEISWSDSQSTAYIARYSTWLNGQFIAEVTSDKGLKQPLLTRLNYLHPLLLPDNHDEWLEEAFNEGVEINSALKEKLLKVKNIHLPSYREIQKGEGISEDPFIEWPIFTDEAYVSEFHELLNEGRYTDSQSHTTSRLKNIEGVNLLHIPLGIKGKQGALVPLGKPVVSSLSLNDQQKSEAIHEILSDILIAPLDNLRSILNDSLCIGPLRDIPNASYQVNPQPAARDWYRGLAAWDILSKMEPHLIHSVHQWISRDDKLDLGYGLSIQAEKNVVASKPLAANSIIEETMSTMNLMLAVSYTNLEESVGVLNQLSQKTKYSLWDYQNKIAVLPSDIGVGISQLMPLVVATFHAMKGVVAIEQPELHVHPKIQVSIGDLLTQSNSKCKFLVETHSEHLILRLLRRVRETARGSLPEGIKPVKPEDISVVYLSNTKKGVHAQRFAITEDGDFELDWPDGFFGERDEELF